MQCWAPHTIDAIVVVPGIMGSVLKDAQRGVVWGFEDPRTYLSFWCSGVGLSPLAFTPAELDAIAEDTYDLQTARVQPAGLIRFSAFSPVTGGVEPYTELVRALREASHPDAVLEFAYDWRLPTRLNSARLAREMKDHLARWRAHEAYAEARRVDPDQRDAQLVIVAHSMGGLVARGLGDSRIENGLDDVRQVITLGTPFLGSVKSTVMLERGEGVPVPLPRRRLRAAARTMPGVYDLLPRHRCLVSDRGGVDDVVALTVDDVASIGGDRALAEAACLDFKAARSVVLPGHRPVVGVAQPTWQSLQIRDGVVEPVFSSYRWDQDGQLLRDEIGRPLAYNDQGDGTVWRYAARPEGSAGAWIPVAQQHGALAKSRKTITEVVALVTDQEDLGVQLGDGALGLHVPDVADVGAPFTVTVTGETDPASVRCRVVDASTNDLVRTPGLRSVDGDYLEETLSLPDPGLFRVEVKTSGGDWVTQIMMITPPER